ncbi:hypothetical protein HX109_07630 [Galbibacter sp. BG1]|uniref:hypothetical protein n=1 Tax=Galbibacter sp. BG1 TaxID=1170699 RepID=UPI0015BC39E2|nr:hypothetical protein [Galbibacter sp. BG1]QLE01440.1 hypothetical protein HX109_07630 [Galbibacter sp. BG1]
MLRIYSIAFTLLYLLAMLKPVLPVFDYVVNHDYIAEYLCINKDRPEMHCDGKCYLMQMLEEENQQKKQNLPAIDLREYPIGFVSFLSLENTGYSIIPEKKTTLYFNKYSFLASYKYFHPPSLS